MTSEATYLDLASLKGAVERGEELDYLLFWGHRARKDGKLGPTCLSQWWPTTFSVAGQRYTSAEQYMMAEKALLFGDHEVRAQMLAASDPGKIKALGRRVRGFDEQSWVDARFDVVVRGNRAKFSQNDPLRFFLLGTRNKVLVEASPRDRIWGIGLAADDARARDPRDWLGSNLLGFALMTVRRDLAPNA